MKCSACGKPATGALCDGCSGDRVKAAFARNRPVTVEELREIAGDKPSAFGKERASKFAAQPQVVDGIRFDSKREARRYGVLKLRQQAGEIRDLRWHVRFPLHCGGVQVTAYEADFVYVVVSDDSLVVEDTKGVRTPVYKLKKKMMLAELGIVIAEV